MIEKTRKYPVLGEEAESLALFLSEKSPYVKAAMSICEISHNYPVTPYCECSVRVEAVLRDVLAIEAGMILGESDQAKVPGWGVVFKQKNHLYCISGKALERVEVSEKPTLSIASSLTPGTNGIAVITYVEK